MTIRSTIGTAEVTLESAGYPTIGGTSYSPTYDLGDLMNALTEVLRAVGDYRLPDLAGQVLTLLEGEDLPAPAVAPLVGRQRVTYRGEPFEVQYVDLMSAREEDRAAHEPEGRIRVVLTLDPEQRNAEEEDEDNLPWSPPVAGATGDPRL